MPFEINMGQFPGGYANTSARPGENFEVVYREFTSTEDGQHFIRRLEGFPSDIIKLAPSQIKPSQVDSLLAILRIDGTGTIYLNEIPLVVIARATGPIRAWSAVYKDDIVDIERVQLDVGIPEDAGFMYLFSAGWRKGLFYDFSPLGPGHQPRQYDASALLGSAVAHVFFQERFAITEKEWRVLFERLWFPFAGLRNQTITGLLNHVRSGWDCDDMLDLIVEEMQSRVEDMLASWRNHPTLSQHIDILEHAVEEFLEDDAVSCTGLLYPRIEGIIRTYHHDTRSGGGTSQGQLADLAVESKVSNDRSLLLPHRFREYLDEVYFADFNLRSAVVPLSRNSIGHGVAKPADFDRKSAGLGILVVHQLFYFLSD